MFDFKKELHGAIYSPKGEQEAGSAGWGCGRRDWSFALGKQAMEHGMH